MIGRSHDLASALCVEVRFEVLQHLSHVLVLKLSEALPCSDSICRAPIMPRRASSSSASEKGALGSAPILQVWTFLSLKKHQGRFSGLGSTGDQQQPAAVQEPSSILRLPRKSHEARCAYSVPQPDIQNMNSTIDHHHNNGRKHGRTRMARST